MIQFKPLYLFLKLYIPPTIRLYFRRLKIIDRHKVPRKGAVIFAPNHQNAFMDALLVAGLSPRNPWFLTRASVFKKSTARFWLKSMRMIAIYRFRDGLSNVKKNDAVIDTCSKLLEKQQSILIFPEGNHDMRWSLRSLQKGIARISFAAESANDFSLGLKIVPVGLQYEDHTAFRSDVLLIYGDPILVSNYKDLFKEDPQQATEKLLADLRRAIEPLILNIQPLEKHDEIKELIRSNPTRKKELVERLKEDKQVIEDADKTNWSIDQEKISLGSRLWYSLKLVLGFPIYLYGRINHIIPVFAIKLIINKAVSDIHFTASIKYAGIIFIAPIFYLLQTILVYLLTGCWDVTLLYLVTLPFFGIFSYEYERMRCGK